MRILVTGSPNWNSPYQRQKVNTVLYTTLSLHEQIDAAEKLIVVYGTAESGVAGIVNEWVLKNQVVAEQVPIDMVSANRALAVALALGRVDLWLSFLDEKQQMVTHFRMTTPVVPHTIRADE